MNLAALSDVIFKDEDAWQAWLRDHWLAHEGLTQATLDAGLFVENYPLVEFDEQRFWMQRHQLMHQQLASQWLVDPPPDLENWDLSSEDDFYQWTLAHAEEHTRISLIVGVE